MKCNRRIRCFCFVLAAIICGHPLLAQSGIEASTSRQWFSWFENVEVGPHWRFSVDGSFREAEWFGYRSQVLGRVATGYTFDPRFSVGLGLVLSHARDNAGSQQLDKRIYQDFNYRMALGKWTLIHRIRTEERWLQNRTRSPWSQASFRFRPRYSLTFNRPLTPKDKFPALSIQFGNEVFFQSPAYLGGSWFQLNRLFAGPQLALRSNLVATLLVVGEMATLGPPGSYRFDPIFWLQVRHTLRFKPKAK